MSDPNFVEFERLYSPDSSNVILNYGIDLGAFGYGRAGKAVLTSIDSTVDLKNFTIQGNLIKVRWKNQDTISAKLDVIPYLRENKKYKIKNQTINGIEIEVQPYDYIEPGFKRIIECREVSPDEKHELIAYRYMKENGGLNFIHVSIIETGQEIPKYGNFLIADMQSDYVFDGEWIFENKLAFYTNELYADLVQYFFVKDRPGIEYELRIDNERFSSKYRWIR
ncbi:MAG: hypothetical protein ABFS32_15285 [Bacteroidota bacterium]